MTTPTKLWAIFRDGKVLVAHASRRNARDQLDAYKLDGHSKHKWAMAPVRVLIADGVSGDK